MGGRFGFVDAFSAPVVGEYADATARRSVAYLDRVNAFHAPVVGYRRRNIDPFRG
jgi:hypothetical protein